MMLLLAWLLVSVGVGVIFGAAIDRERPAVRIAFFGVGGGGVHPCRWGVLVGALWGWPVTQLSSRPLRIAEAVSTGPAPPRTRPL